MSLPTKEYESGIAQLNITDISWLSILAGEDNFPNGERGKSLGEFDGTHSLVFCFFGQGVNGFWNMLMLACPLLR